MLCVAAGGAVLALAVDAFTLEWTHTVERVQWWERWEVSEAGLRPVEARVVGSGAGMEPPEGAGLMADGWHYAPQVPPLPEVSLASTGQGDGWQFCAGGACRVFAGEVRLWVAEGC